MKSFVESFESAIEKDWQEMVKRQEEKRCTPHEDLLVVGRKRMNLIYRILSEDMIEEICRTDTAVTDPLAYFSEKMASELKSDYPFVSWTMQTLMDKGYLRHGTNPGGSFLYWTHNASNGQ